MGNEWLEAQQMGAPGPGGRGGVCVRLGESEGGSHREEIEGEDIWKHYTAHTVITFSHAQLIFLAASLAQGESLSGQSCWTGFDRGVGMM